MMIGLLTTANNAQRTAHGELYTMENELTAQSGMGHPAPARFVKFFQRSCSAQGAYGGPGSAASGGAGDMREGSCAATRILDLGEAGSNRVMAHRPALY